MTAEHDETLTAAAAAVALYRDGWRLLLGGAYSSVGVGSLTAAVEVAAAAVRVCGPDAAHLRLELRADRVDLVLRTPADEQLSRLDATLAARISAAVGELGLATTPRGAARSVQALEIAIDALDIAAVLPFWRAVFGYVVADRPIAEGYEVIVVDPAGQGPTIWFQQLDAPRAGGSSAPRGLGRSGSSPTRRATRSASAPGRTATDTPTRTTVEASPTLGFRHDLGGRISPDDHTSRHHGGRRGSRCSADWRAGR